MALCRIMRQTTSRSTSRAADIRGSECEGLGPGDLDRALAHLERAEGTTVRSIVGINEDRAFGTSCADWQPDRPDARREAFIPLLWLNAWSRPLRQLRQCGLELRVVPSCVRQREGHGHVRHHAHPLESLTFHAHVRYRQHQ